MNALVLIILLALTGCDHLAIEQRPITPGTSRTIELDRQPRGVADVAVEERPNQDGWIIQVTQDYALTTETQIREEVFARRYRAWPLAPLTGLLQCPIGSLIGLFTPWTTMGSVGCHRLIGQEPLASIRPISTTIARTRTTAIAPAPVLGATVTLIDPATDTTLFQGTTNEHGITTIRTYPHTEGQPRTPSASLTVKEGPITLSRKTLTPAPSQSWVPPPQRQDVPWPAIQIFQIVASGIDGTAEEQLVRKDLQNMLLREGVCVIGEQRTIRAIQQEHGLQLAGRLADQTPVRTGHLLAPTILVTPTITTAATDRDILLTFTHVQEAAALAVVKYNVPTNTLWSVSNEAAGRIHQLLEGAHRNGCPLR
jgi:hypothetical protein